MYRISWPWSRLLGRFGVPLMVKVYIKFDAEAGVFVAISPDVAGLVVEGETLDEIAREVRDLVPALMSSGENAGRKISATRLSFTDTVPCR